MRNKILIAILAASTGWGLAGVGTRAAYSLGATTLTVLVVRTAIASLVLLIYVLGTRSRSTSLAWRHGALIGALRTGLTPMFFMASLNFISAGVEGLVITLVPATTAVMAALFIRERITGRQIAGLIIGLVGTTMILIVGDTGLGVEGDIVSGFLLAGVGVLLGSFSGVLQRKYAPLHDTVPLAFPMFVTGTIVSIAVGAFVGFDDLSTYDADLWILLTVLGLGSTLLPFGATLYASKQASATLVAVTAYLAPLVAIVGGAVLLEEQITPAILAGGAVTLLGVSLVGRGRRTTT
ncbi:MAG: DMT family transporter [Acidimicrobiia bacterium]|nr:MAG: DMT family transporter [Acidimicrobiia bacterium]